MTQVLEVVEVKAGDASLTGQKFKTRNALSKHLNANDVVVVLETGGTKADGLNRAIGYRKITKTGNGEVQFSRPTTLEKINS